MRDSIPFSAQSMKLFDDIHAYCGVNSQRINRANR